MDQVRQRAERSGSSRGAALAALGLVVVGTTVLASVVVLSVQSPPPSVDETTTFLGWVGQGVAILAFLLSGSFIISRQPRNTIGWLLVIPGLAPAVSELIILWLAGFEQAPTDMNLGLWLAIWFTNWAWILLIFPIFLILLTFPDGRLLSARWRWVVVLVGLMTAVMLGLSAFSTEMSVVVGVDEELLWSVSNAIGFIPGSETFDQIFALLWSTALLTLTVASVAAIVIRFRGGDRVEREQLKWPLWAVLFFGMVYGVAASTGGFGGISEVFFGLALAAIPISVAVAVVRYRLYEIDRIISRTVSYLLVVALLGAVFFGSVALVTTFLPAESDLAVAASTLAVAALFNPVRRRVLVVIDRRFNRARYDAQKVMDTFAASLRDEVDSAALSVGWRDVVTETMEPSAVGVWVRPAGRVVSP